MVLSRFSIRYQLVAMISFVVFIALIFASLLIYNISLRNYKNQMVKDTQSLAQMIGVNNQSALAFGDKITAEEILSKLNSNKAIEVVVLLTPERTVFANYIKGERPKWIIIRKKLNKEYYEFSKTHLELVSAINFDNEKIADLYLKVNLDSLSNQMRKLKRTLLFGIIATYIFSLISILYVSKYITAPILNLAKVVKNISDKKDYSIRVQNIEAKTEINLLYSGFNDMLNVIELRNNEIMVALESISEQKAEIEDQRDYIMDQRDQIEEQSKILELWKKDITASINYAKNIQNNMLLSIDKVKEIYSKLFMLFKPRDIVSGDFYWCDKIGDSLIFCAADCTGHGVPGAMISVIGFNLLNQIIVDRKITDPHLILNELDKDIIKFFRKDQHSNTSDDGMDLGICKLNLKTNKLQFSGANNSAFIVRNMELIELVADKHSLGSGSALIVREKGFSMHEFDVEANDTIYLYSDGYMDQFGGPNGKKFMKKNFKRLLVDISQDTVNRQLELLEDKLAEWKGELDQVDDIIVLGVKI